jgi:hypothetical protein
VVQTHVNDVIYRGQLQSASGTRRGIRSVTRHEGNRATPLELRLDIVNHSPDGFNWGYKGSGPAQLSLALLADAIPNDVELKNRMLPAASGKEDLVRLFAYNLLMQVVCRLHDDEWELKRSMILSWLSAKLAESFGFGLHDVSVASRDMFNSPVSARLVSTTAGNAVKCNRCQRQWDMDEGLQVGDNCPICTA